MYKQYFSSVITSPDLPPAPVTDEIRRQAARDWDAVDARAGPPAAVAGLTEIKSESLEEDLDKEDGGGEGNAAGGMDGAAPVDVGEPPSYQSDGRKIPGGGGGGDDNEKPRHVASFNHRRSFKAKKKPVGEVDEIPKRVVASFNHRRSFLKAKKKHAYDGEDAEIPERVVRSFNHRRSFLKDRKIKQAFAAPTSPRVPE